MRHSGPDFGREWIGNGSVHLTRFIFLENGTYGTAGPQNLGSGRFHPSPLSGAQCHPGPSEGMRSLQGLSVLAFTHQSGFITEEPFLALPLVMGCSALSPLSFGGNELLGSAFLNGWVVERGKKISCTEGHSMAGLWKEKKISCTEGHSMVELWKKKIFLLPWGHSMAGLWEDKKISPAWC